VKESEIAAALPDADNDLLLAIAVTGLAKSFFTRADVSLIYLNRTIHHWALDIGHRFADSMAEIPCRLIASNAQSSFDLVRRDTLPRFHEEQNGHEPSFQGKMCIVKYRLRCHAKLVMAFAAFKLRILKQFKHFLALAAKALNAIRPTEFFQQSAALFIS
jgi:hypothetical protein